MKKGLVVVFVYSAIAFGLFLFHNAWSALLAFHFSILLSLFILKPDLPVRTLFTSYNLKWVLVSMLLCGSTGVMLYFFWNKFGLVEDLSTHVEEMGLNGSTWLPFLFYFALVNPWIEEYFWRGYLGSTTRSFHFSDFAYAGFHGLILINKVEGNMIVYSLALLILAGWLWRQIFRTDKGLLAPVLGHMAADLTILLAVYLRVV